MKKRERATNRVEVLLGESDLSEVLVKVSREGGLEGALDLEENNTLLS